MKKIFLEVVEQGVCDIDSSQKNMVQNLDAITPQQEETLLGEARLCSGKMKKT